VQGDRSAARPLRRGGQPPHAPPAGAATERILGPSAAEPQDGAGRVRSTMPTKRVDGWLWCHRTARRRRLSRHYDRPHAQGPDVGGGGGRHPGGQEHDPAWPRGALLAAKSVALIALGR